MFNRCQCSHTYTTLKALLLCIGSHLCDRACCVMCLVHLTRHVHTDHATRMQCLIFVCTASSCVFLHLLLPGCLAVSWLQMHLAEVTLTAVCKPVSSALHKQQLQRTKQQQCLGPNLLLFRNLMTGIAPSSHCTLVAARLQHPFSDQHHKPANINRAAPCQTVMTTVELL